MEVHIMLNKIVEALVALLKVKSLITIALTGVMVALLIGAFDPAKEVLALFCTSYGAIITYFFTHKKDDA
jgi:uncharacterized membrane protein